MRSPLADLSKLTSPEAEAAVLASMIVDPRCIGRVLPRLPRADMFFGEGHQVIYEAIVALFTAGQAIDGLTVRQHLQDAGEMEAIGGIAYLQALLETVPSAANATYYADVVREKDKERQLRSTVERVNRIVDGCEPLAERLAEIQNAVLELEAGRSAPDYVELKDVATQSAAAMFEANTATVCTGFHALDRLVQGFAPGELVILAGRPSMGKSALMLGITMNVSSEGKAVLIFSLEMTFRSLVERILCSLACIDAHGIRQNRDNMYYRQAVEEQALALRQRNVIISPIAQNPAQQRALIHRLRQRYDIGLVCIDYLQLMTTTGRSESRQQEITTISRQTKELATQEEVPVLALSQLNRQVDARENHRPRLSDLRESGSLEQDADKVLLMYREDYYHKDELGYEPTGVTEIIVAKNRSGRQGTAELVFVDDLVKFSDMPPRFAGEAVQF